MSSELLGILFALIASLTYGLSAAMAKVPVQIIGSVRSIFWRNIVVIIVLLLVLAITSFGYAFNLGAALFTILIALIGYIGLLLFYHALKTGKVGIIAPIVSTTSIFTALFSFLFFGEILPQSKMMAILTIVLGIGLFSLKLKNFRNSAFFQKESGVPYALLTCFLWGLMFSFYRIPISTFGPVYTSFFLELGVVIFSFCTLLISKKSLKPPEKNLGKHLLVIGLLAALGTFFYNWAGQLISITIVGAVTATRSVVAAFYGKKVFKEIFEPKQIIGIALTLIGLVALAVL